MADPEKADETSAAVAPAGPTRVDALSDDAPGADGTQTGSGRAKRAAIVGLRLVTGIVGVAAAAATIAAVGLTPLPTFGITPPGVEVVPDPADQVRTCAGSALRLGDETGANADVPQPLGVASVRSDSVATTLDSAPVPVGDAGNGGTSSAPQVLTVSPADGALLAGAQSQEVDAADYSGYAAVACAEPSSSIWLAGGATTVGRTTLLTLTNPTAVAATVRLTILGEGGSVSAPGLTGIDVQPGTQRVLSLAGFAPGLVSPVVHVEARGGQVVAFLQQSIVRGLDASGLEIIGGTGEPAAAIEIPGVRIFDGIGTTRSLGLPDWDDVSSIVRIANPGAEDATVEVSVVPLTPGASGTSFVAEVAAGGVDEFDLDSGSDTDGAGLALPDGTYTVRISSDQPVVTGVRVSTAVDPGELPADGEPVAPESDVAWYAAAPALEGDTLVTVAPGPDPQLVAVNPTDADVTISLDAQDGTDSTLLVPAGGTSQVAVEPGVSYLLSDAAGASVAISYAGEAQLAAYQLAPARPVSTPLTIRP